MFMDKTKAKTNNVNRLINGSFFIYMLENSITFAEINKTIALKIKPTGSIIIGKVKSNADRHVMCQNMIVVLLYIRACIAKKNIIIDMAISPWKARDGKRIFSDNMIKSKKLQFCGHNTMVYIKLS